MSLSKFLKNRLPRPDLRESFQPDLMEEHQPVLINTMPMLVAVAVGVRLLKVVADRGGTRVKPSAASKVLDVIGQALPDEVVAHCDDEVARILDWLQYPPTEPSPQFAVKDLEVMHRADLEYRVSVAEYAIDEGLDLEFEYWDEERNIWPRVRATPVTLSNGDSPALVARDDNGWVEVELVNVRWLMPVESAGAVETPRHAKILQFRRPDR